MSLGKDLATIRKNQNLTQEDIQNAIKIPLDTIKSIESDSIFDDPNLNTTYVRSFVRSYAKVLKLNDADVVKALDDMEVGIYSGNLLAGSKEANQKINRGTFFEETEPKNEPDSKLDTSESQVLPETEAEKKPAPPEKIATPEVNSVNWADMGRKFTTAGKKPKVWLVISILIILGLIFGGGYVFWDQLSSLFAQNESNIPEEQTRNQQSGQETIIPMPVDSSLNEDQQGNNSPSEAQNQAPAAATNEQMTLGDTLTVAVYAAYGQLEPIRITSDFNWRTDPFWMEEGEAYNFDFRDTLLVRGQYSRLLLLFNGHVIENPRQNYFNTSFNSIMITRSILDDPRYLAPAPREFPLEIGAPDSTLYRIRY